MTNHISLGLSGSWNSRDIATIGGVKPGVMLRSANLTKLTESGQNKLLDLNVTDVIDLRSEREVKEDGIDKLPSSISLHFLSISAGDVSNLKNVFDINTAESIKTLMADARAEQLGTDYMSQMYRLIIANPESARQIIDAVKIISSAKGATLVHCTAGKDRTGIVAALILRLLDVDSQIIMKDYLYSNNSVKTLEANVGTAAMHSRFNRALLEVRAEYLESAWSEMQGIYNNFDNFLVKNGFGKTDIDALHRKFN